MDPVTGKPTDYAELFEEYFPMMLTIVRRSGIASEDVEEVTMDLLARFIEMDGMAHYDPNHLHDVGENPDLPGPRLRKATFKGMLRGFTSVYVLRYRDKQMLRHRTFPWRLEAPVSTHDDTTWASLYDDATPDPVDALTETEVSVALAQALRGCLANLKARNAKRDYDKFLTLVVHYGYLDGKLQRQKIAEEMGISVSTVASMVAETRAELHPVLAESNLFHSKKAVA